MMGYVLGVLFGIAIAAGFAGSITISMIRKSNDFGNHKAPLRDFGHLEILESEDGMHSIRVAPERGIMTLAERRRKVIFENEQDGVK